MPRFDGTGPAGHGPMTGRSLGPCRGYGRGCGRGSSWGYRRFITKKEEKEILEEEMNLLEEEIKAIKERIKELD